MLHPSKPQGGILNQTGKYYAFNKGKKLKEGPESIFSYQNLHTTKPEFLVSQRVFSLGSRLLFALHPPPEAAPLTNPHSIWFLNFFEVQKTLR